MKLLMLLAVGGVLSIPAYGAEEGCAEGSYSVIVAPDQTTLSILFDRFQVDRALSKEAAMASKVCHIVQPLNLPANKSLGVYKVDYRGFARLAPAQQALLDVQYALGPRDHAHGRVFSRKVRGAHDGDFFFTENIGAGQMKRVGCGVDAKLDVRIALTVNGAGDAMAALDSIDGTNAAMVYHLDLKNCR